MIVRILVYLSSLLLELTSKFYFTKIWILPKFEFYQNLNFTKIWILPKFEFYRIFWETFMLVHEHVANWKQLYGSVRIFA